MGCFFSSSKSENGSNRGFMHPSYGPGPPKEEAKMMPPEKAPPQINEQHLQILVEMGFAEDDARRALEENDHNFFLALLMLINGYNTKA